MALALPVALCLASGYLIAALGWSRRPSSTAHLLLRASLSVGYGLGLFSGVFFLMRVFNLAQIIVVDAVVVALLAVSYLVLRAHVPAATAPTSSSQHFGFPLWLNRFLIASFAVALCAALYSAILRTIIHPHGEGWDAFAIWNLHARFFFRGGSGWRGGFSALIPGSHPDYPLLLPTAIAHFWSYLGREDQAVPAMIGLAFTFGTAGVLISSLALLRGRISAILGGMTLLATPFFIENGTSQYADVPLSFFLLAAIVMFRLYDQCSSDAVPPPRGPLVLAGLATGFAAWTKNEGLLFLVALVAAQLLIRRRARNHTPNQAPPPDETPAKYRIELAPFLLSVVPVLLLIAWFKRSVAPSSELFADPHVMFHKIISPARYGAIVKWYGKEFLRFGHWLLIPGTVLLVALYFARGGKVRAQPRTGVRASAVALALTLAGYFAIYLITPYDLYWHLRFSLNRLFLQLWPSAIFLFFATVPFPDRLGLNTKTVSK